MSKRDLPEDLCTEIVSRLPVKSLLRFRSVSNSWLALIDDPEFARFHLNNFRNNRDEAQLLVFPDCELRSSKTLSSETFEIDSGIICTPICSLGVDCPPSTTLDIVCSVDGLLLLTRTSAHRSYPDFVWNPSIRKFRELPYLPNVVTCLNIHLRYDAKGLGYDQLAKAYKIVKLIFVKGNDFGSHTLHSVAIFTLGVNSWKIMKFQDMRGFIWHWRQTSDRHGLYFEGCLYFIASKRDLVSFELSSEVFSFIILPDVNHYDPCHKLAVVDGGCTMAAFYSSLRECSVWVLDTESMNWTRRYTFQLGLFELLHLKNNGDILAWKDRRVKKEKVEWRDQIISYSPKTDKYRIVQEKGACYYKIISHVSGYVQSLILHK